MRMLKATCSQQNEALASPPLDNAPKEYSPKIQQLVQDIASLTLLEISDLNELLKVPVFSWEKGVCQTKERQLEVGRRYTMICFAASFLSIMLFYGKTTLKIALFVSWSVTFMNWACPSCYDWHMPNS